MNARFTPGLTALTLATIAACSANGGINSGEVQEDGDAGLVTTTDAGADTGVVVTDDSGNVVTPPSDGGTATFVDSGPPATVGGEDSGSPVIEPDAGLAPGACNGLGDCPYQSEPGVSGVSCDTTNHVCDIECAGDNYDVNGLVTDGCEIAEPCATNNGGSTLCPVEHAVATATDLGSFSCDDTSSKQDIVGALPSDDRTHTNPAVVAFDGVTGAAPIAFKLQGTGGLLCEDDINLDLQIKSPSTHLNCYSFVVQVVGGSTYTCAQTDPTGLCQIANGSGSYSDGDEIDLTVSKIETCLAGETDDAAFAITGHL